jgi:hypothetical protein
MGGLIPAGTGMEFYRKIKIPEEVIERGVEAGSRASTLPSTWSTPSTSGRGWRRRSPSFHWPRLGPRFSKGRPFHETSTRRRRRFVPATAPRRTFAGRSRLTPSRDGRASHRLSGSWSSA